MNDDAVFWDRLFDMPAWEAEQECVIRRESLVLENAMLNGENVKAYGKEKAAIGLAVQGNNSVISKLNERIKYLRKLQDRVQWRNAVYDLFGQDAVDQCLIYMAQQSQPMMEPA
jgi:hypothetical protein